MVTLFVGDCGDRILAKELVDFLERKSLKQTTLKDGTHSITSYVHPII
jgi:hypothetical protein